MDVGTERSATESTVAAVGLLVAIYGLRLALFSPSLVHANFHGGSIVDSILDASSGTHRSEFGPLTFTVLGAMARMLGGNLRALAAANQLLSVGTLGLIAWTAWRWSGRRAALWGPLLAGALNPLFTRLGASEDAHVLAAFVGWLGLLALDTYSTSRRWGWLALATVSLALLPFARQTFYLWVPIVFGLALARSRANVLRWPEFWLSAVVCAGALVWRVLFTFGVASDVVTLRVLPRFFTHANILIGLATRHPLLDVSRFAALYLPLAIVGIVCLRRQRALVAAYAGALVAYFVLTLPFGWHAPGVEFGFRLPVASLGFVAVGVGVACIADRAVLALPRARAALLAVGAVVLTFSPSMLRGWAYAREVSPQTQEYLWLARVAAELPRSVTVVDLRIDEPGPAYVVPRLPFREAGIDAAFMKPSELGAQAFLGPRPVYFVEGVGCHAFAMGELLDSRIHELSDDALIEYLMNTSFPWLVRHRIPPGLADKPALREACRSLVAAGAPVGKALEIRHAPHELPFVIYADVPFRLKLHKLSRPPNAPSS